MNGGVYHGWDGFPEEWRHESVELALFVQNTAAVWSQRVEPMFRAAERHYNAGRGDAEKLAAGLYRVISDAARLYVRTHCSPGDSVRDLFPVAVRRDIAHYFACYFETEREAGNQWN